MDLGGGASMPVGGLLFPFMLVAEENEFRELDEEVDDEEEEVEVLVAVLYVESASESESEGLLSVWGVACV